MLIMHHSLCVHDSMRDCLFGPLLASVGPLLATVGSLLAPNTSDDCFKNGNDVKFPSDVQVSCAATGSIIVRLLQLTPVADGYAKLTLLNVAGSGAVSAVALAPTATQVCVISVIIVIT